MNLSKVNPTLLLKYFTRAELDPFNASGGATLSLLGELSSSAAYLGRNE